MLEWIFRGLRNGVLTTRYPRHRDPYADTFAAAVAVVDPVAEGDLAALCPTRAIARDERGEVTLDRGRCILCGRCVDRRPDAFGWARGTDTARLTRPTLVVPERDEDDRALVELRTELNQRVRRLRRSVHIRHVDAGSDGSDEWEIAALTNPVYDVHRLGIFFTASPRHADILLVTGAGARGMVPPLARTLEAMPEPTVILAVGTDAISGGLISPSYATAGGISHQLSVDVWVPGSPASPFAILHGILLALDRVPEANR
ncbi:MAG TPA: ferredoxin [Pseudonocardiaceae bacterium]|jgi:Ni,Fe-hydrogenase III small subunit/ferredoxin|nr:ferredoxin [Pseudonocardiaceae bacterium]